MKDVVNFLKAKLCDNDKVIIACSGGSDSMALLHLVMQNFNHQNIICAHVNHKVRKQSDIEYKYVESFCLENDIVFEGLEIATKFKQNFEDEARKVRYIFFDTLLKKYNAKYILTAHHGDDLVETVLMRITRGSTLNGYAGIKEIDGNLLRPLLQVSKEDILRYIKKSNLKYYEDATNSQDFNTRNKYRHHVLPFLKKVNKDVHKKYLKFSQELLEYDDFLKKYVDKMGIIKNNKVSTQILAKESLLVQKKVLELLVKAIQKEDYLDINDKNVESMLNIINSSKSNNIINLSNGYVAQKNYNEFSIIKQNINNDYKILYEGTFINADWKITTIKHSNEKSNYVIRLDSKQMKLPLYIRNRKNGDVIALKNLGHKKLKDIFIDEKIVISQRDRYPVLVDSEDNVLWLPGLKKSKFDKDNDEKYDIILSSERNLK